MSTPENNLKESALPMKTLELVNWVADRAIKGKGPFLSAQELAAEYLNDPRYAGNRERIRALIRWESTKNFGTGFVTGLGGIVTLPAAVPASLGASWVVQARMAGAIATIHGHDIREDRVRTLVLLSLIGSAAMDELKRLGVKITNRAAHTVVRQISGRLVMEINRTVGFRLLSKTGQRGVVSLAQLARVTGGVVGGIFDGVACRTVGKVADSLFDDDGGESSRTISVKEVVRA